MKKESFSIASKIILSLSIIAALQLLFTTTSFESKASRPIRPLKTVAKIMLNYKSHGKEAANLPLIPDEPPAPPEPVFPSTVDDSYFDDALFLGNSRTEGLIMQTDLTSDYLACKGLNVDNVYSKAFVPTEEGLKPVMDVIGDREFSKIYIMFGLNEIGWPDEEAFVAKYRKMVQDIRATHPDATVYIQSILPVSQHANDTDYHVNNERIRLYNGMLEQMAAEEGVYFVNVYEALAVDGVLPPEAAFDGIHLNHDYCQIWLDYLKTHAAV